MRLAAAIRLPMLFVAASLCAAGAAAQSAAGAVDAARSAWGFDRTGMAPHPGVRFGVLPNGMRYALMRNAVPAGALAIRLHFRSGSRVESARERGFMHLLEHLVFEGSQNLPRGALQLMLQHQGLRRWADFNAFTGLGETLYRLDLQRSDQRARETALTVMREVATGLAFDRATVERGKRAVTAELARHDPVRERILAEQSAFFVPGTAPEDWQAAGSAASVRRAGGAALRRLHERHYRPERATLILVGDFDPAAAEAELTARFADWRGRSAPPADAPLRTAPASRRSESRFFIDGRAPTAVTLAAAAPPVHADTGAGRDAAFLQRLAGDMLNRRLARIAARADAPFASADASTYDHFGAAQLARIDIAPKDRDWRAALEGGERELRRALAGGFSAEELDEQLALARRALERPRPRRVSSELADSIASAVGRGLVFTEGSDAPATLAYLDRIRLDAVNAALRSAWAASGRLVFVTHNRPVRDGPSVVAAALASAGRP